MPANNEVTRRFVLKSSLMLPAVFLSGISWTQPRLQIGACDWSLGKGSDPDAFNVAKEIGLMGIQVNLGSLKDNLHLRDKSLQQVYLERSSMTGVKISSLAIAELNNIPFKSDPRTEEWVSDAIDVARNLNVKVILLAFFHHNDLRKDASGKKEVIARLKRLAPKAERMGITLGIESYLNAEELLDIISAVGSPNIKVYYDFRNSADAGYDVIKEINFLGKEMICELHIKENGFLLGEGTLDWKSIAKALVDMEYYGDGWMQIEWSSPKDADIRESYKHNLQFLRKLFPS